MDIIWCCLVGSKFSILFRGQQLLLEIYLITRIGVPIHSSSVKKETCRADNRKDKTLQKNLFQRIQLHCLMFDRCVIKQYKCAVMLQFCSNKKFLFAGGLKNNRILCIYSKMWLATSCPLYKVSLKVFLMQTPWREVYANIILSLVYGSNGFVIFFAC